jgi:tetratricopeptide (TPR) repeat protein/DNA-binding SARP family transcriptional activator
VTGDIETWGPPTFRLVGPMAVHSGGGLVRCGDTKQDAIFARLLLSANEPVDVEAIRDDVWGDEPSTDALVAVYVARLRRTYEVEIGRGPAYRLVVDPIDVDVHRFRLLCAMGGADVDLARRATDLALALCPDTDLLTNLDGDWLAPHRAAFADDWYDAMLKRNDLWLTTGRHEALMAVLRPVVTARPDDERLAEDYLLAMYRSGRPGEAIAHYRALYQRIGEVHGRPVSSRLLKLSGRMLRQEDSLDYDDAPDAPPAAPSTLAPPPAAVVGRDAELAELRARLVDAGPRGVATLVIDGPPTIGKTSTALALAHDVRADYPGGALQANLGGSRPTGPVTVSGVLDEFLVALGITPARLPVTLATKLALYRSIVGGRRMLVLLDDVDASEDVIQLMPTAPGSVVIVTSRRRLTGLVTAYQAVPLTLGPLSDADSRALLGRFVRDGRAAGDPGSLDRIVAACGGMPLAVCLVGAQLGPHREASLADAADALADRAGRLRVLDRDAERADAMEALFQWSYGTLPADEARMFRLLGVAPCGSLSPAGAAALADIDEAEAGRLLDALAERFLIVAAPHRRFRLLDLLAVYAAELSGRAESPAQADAAIGRLVAHLVATARDAVGALWSSQPAGRFADPGDAADWLDTEHPVLLDIALHCAAHGRAADVLELSQALSRYLDHSGHLAAAAELHGAAAAAATDPGDRAYSLVQLSAVRIRQGAYDAAEAVLDEALALYTGIDDAGGMASATGNLGRVAQRRGDHAAALDRQRRSVELMRRTGDRVALVRTLINLGIAHVTVKDMPAALAAYAEALAISQDLGVPDVLARSLASIAGVHRRTGRSDEAHSLYTRALEIFRAIHDRTGEAITVNNLGLVAAYRGQARDAVRAHEDALTMFRKMEDHANAVEVLNDLGGTLVGCGRAGEAISRFREARAAAERVGERGELARAHEGLADSHEAMGAPAHGDFDPVAHHAKIAIGLLTELAMPISAKLRAFAERSDSR